MKKLVLAIVLAGAAFVACAATLGNYVEYRGAGGAGGWGWHTDYNRATRIALMNCQAVTYNCHFWTTRLEYR